VSRTLSGFVLRATLRLGRCRVGGDGPLVMGAGFGDFLDRDHVSISSEYNTGRTVFPSPAEFFSCLVFFLLYNQLPWFLYLTIACFLQIDAHVGGVNDIAFAHPNKQLCIITCGDDKTIKVSFCDGLAIGLITLFRYEALNIVYY
jgi:WD40 repeat protein